jgi:hypothetical protein
MALVSKYGLGYGVRARISRELGVSGATTTRDIQFLFESREICPCCNSLVYPDQLSRPAGPW